MTSFIKNTVITPIPGERQKLNHLIEKLNARKKLLKHWQDAVLQYQFRVETDYNPAVRAINTLRIKQLELFDDFFQNHSLKKSEQEKLKHFIATIAYALIKDYGMNQLTELHDKYSKKGFKYKLKHNKNCLELIHNSSNFIETDHVLARQKFAKSHEKLYRKLTTLLQHDFSGKIEPEDRIRLMDAVILAYQENDLMALFELQLEIEGFELDNLDAIPTKRLKSLNKILSVQGEKIVDEIQKIERIFFAGLKMQFFSHVNPDNLIKQLDADIKSLEIHADELQQDITILQQPENIKRWLQNYNVPKKSSDTRQ